MGGAKSKFEECDWVRANGNLTCGDDTIDGNPPTQSYGVYYMAKRGIGQREFDVTDIDMNLLYTTRAVPGTLCWFDVFGRGMDECLMRVQVDLSRRYWIVYRYGIPAFAGQLADMEATEKLAQERREAADKQQQQQSTSSSSSSSLALPASSLSACQNSQRHKSDSQGPTPPLSTATPFLFRKCCITISWSRYMAVSMHYGSPVLEKMIRSKHSSSAGSLASLGGQSFGEPDDFVPAARDGTNRIRCQESGEDMADDKEAGTALRAAISNNDSDNPLVTEGSTFSEAGESGKKENTNFLQKYVYYTPGADDQDSVKNQSEVKEPTPEGDQPQDNESQSQPQQQLQQSDSETAEVTAPSADNNDNSRNKNWSRPGFSGWIAQQRANFQKGQQRLKHDPLEGTIDLQTKPILLCQEIYDKIIGNHQTSVLCRDEAMQLLREDLEQHMKDGGMNDDDPFLLDQEGLLKDLRANVPKPPPPCSLASDKEQDANPPVEPTANDNIFLRWGANMFRKSEPVQPTNESQSNEQTHQTAPAEATNSQDNKATSREKEETVEKCSLPGHVVIGSKSKNDNCLETKSSTDSLASSTSGEAQEMSKDEPLVSYFYWEREGVFSDPKIKMHVAQGTDLALHVVMAICVNQVRYERNALAMTI